MVKKHGKNQGAMVKKHGTKKRAHLNKDTPAKFYLSHQCLNMTNFRGLFLMHLIRFFNQLIRNLLHYRTKLFSKVF